MSSANASKVAGLVMNELALQVHLRRTSPLSIERESARLLQN